MKKGAERRTGNHKGCPYDRFAGAYFHTNPCVIPAKAGMTGNVSITYGFGIR